MKQILGVFVLALAAVLLAAPLVAGEGEWVTDDHQTIAIHAVHDAMFFGEGGETFDLSDLRDGETRTFGEGAKQITVDRLGDVVTIVREESGDEGKLEILCDAGKDTCQVITFEKDPEKVMIMIKKTRHCINDVGDCDGMNLTIDSIAGAGHAIIKTVKCNDAGECEHFENVIGGPASVEIHEFKGGPHHNMMFISDGHADEVLLSCPEGDSRIHVGLEEAEDTFLCPKHSVPMVKATQNTFIRKIHIKEQP